VLRIPEGTKARRFKKRKEFYDVKISYDAWPLLIDRWAKVIEASENKRTSEANLRGFRNEIEWICKFISKLLMLDPTKIEDISVSYSGASIVDKNLEQIVCLFLMSLEQLKVIMLALKEEDDFVILNSLEAMGSIISAISNLYNQPSYRKVIVSMISEFDKPYSNVYPGYGSSGRNKLSHILKELNNMEFSIGEYPITKAATQLACMIMNDTYPPMYLLSLVNSIKEMRYNNKKDRIEIQANLLETYKQALLKFKTCMTKSNIELKNLQSDAFFGALKDFLNDADIEKLIEDTLELETSNDMEIENQDFQLYSHKLVYVNKLFNSFDDELSNEDILKIKNVISTSLECLQIILNLVFTQITMEKDKNFKEKFGFFHQHHIGHLNVVQYIKNALLSGVSLVSDLDDNRLLLTIASYVRFEDRYRCQTNVRNSEFENLI
jgi:hypothetical protein